MTTPPETVRAEFEAYILTLGYSKHSLILFEPPNCLPENKCKYIDSRVQQAWLAYSAATLAAGERERRVVEALENLMGDVYRLLISGDAGNWHPDSLDAARSVLAGLKKGEV
jgi:hypothetical protein